MPKPSLLWIFPTLSWMILGVWSCRQVDYGYGGTACLCDEDSCDFIGPVEIPELGEYIVYTSNLAGERFNVSSGWFSTYTNSNGSKKKKSHKKWKKVKRNHHLKRSKDEVVLKLNLDKTYQKIYGFGGAFTDSTGINIKSLPKKLQEYILTSYFGEMGIEYNVGRVPIGGTDFSLYSYSYDDGPEDKDLENFALKDFDYEYKIPLVHIAKNLSEDLILYGSAWTAPVWMKTNNSTIGGTIKQDMYQTWANYYLRFLEEYHKNGISFWGITTGNEPSLALWPLILSKINTVGWTPTQLAKWVSENLGPTIRNSEYNDTKIMALDDQRFFLPGLYTVLDGPTNATNYIDGIAVHWYLDQYVSPSILTYTHNKYPDKFILSTEACEGSTLFQKGVRLGDWQRGENYADDIIDDLNNWVTGWVDWNMAVNMSGGPTYVNNVVDSPIIVDSENQVFYRQPMYYCLGHFSKFLPRNSIRVGLNSGNSTLKSVAFKRPDDGVTVVVLNKSNNTVPLTVVRPDSSYLKMDITPKSINTIYW